MRWSRTISPEVHDLQTQCTVAGELKPDSRKPNSQYLCKYSSRKANREAEQQMYWVIIVFSIYLTDDIQHLQGLYYTSVLILLTYGT